MATYCTAINFSGLLCFHCTHFFTDSIIFHEFILLYSFGGKMWIMQKQDSISNPPCFILSLHPLPKDVISML